VVFLFGFSPTMKKPGIPGYLNFAASSTHSAPLFPHRKFLKRRSHRITKQYRTTTCRAQENTSKRCLEQILDLLLFWHCLVWCCFCCFCVKGVWDCGKASQNLFVIQFGWWNKSIPLVDFVFGNFTKPIPSMWYRCMVYHHISPISMYPLQGLSLPRF